MTYTVSKYSPLQRLLHWGIGLIVLAVLAGGLAMGFLGFKGVTEQLGETGRNLLYLLHKSFGLLILAAMVLRIIVRIRKGAPEYDPPLTRMESLASMAVHKGLYLSLFAMPIFGWLATDALDYPVSFFAVSIPQFIDKDPELGGLLYELHEIFGWVLLGLIVVHIGAALMHFFVKRDRVLHRML